MLPSLADGAIVIFKNGPRLCQSPARLGPTIENVGDVGGGSGGDVRQGGWFNNGLRLPVWREEERGGGMIVGMLYLEMEKIRESNSHLLLRST
jgi:hypothetical protein